MAGACWGQQGAHLHVIPSGNLAFFAMNMATQRNKLGPVSFCSTSFMSEKIEKTFEVTQATWKHWTASLISPNICCSHPRQSKEFSAWEISRFPCQGLWCPCTPAWPKVCPQEPSNSLNTWTVHETPRDDLFQWTYGKLSHNPCFFPWLGDRNKLRYRQHATRNVSHYIS